MWREDESSVNNREENRYKSIYIHICIYSFLYYNVILSVKKPDVCRDHAPMALPQFPHNFAFDEMNGSRVTQQRHTPRHKTILESYFYDSSDRSRVCLREQGSGTRTRKTWRSFNAKNMQRIFQRMVQFYFLFYFYFFSIKESNIFW